MLIQCYLLSNFEASDIGTVTNISYISLCVCLIRWLSMTISGQRRTSRQALQPLMNPRGRVQLYQRERPAPMWQSSPCTWAGWNKDTGTSSASQMGLSVRWDTNCVLLCYKVPKIYFHYIFGFRINTRLYLGAFRVNSTLSHWRWS